MTLPRAEIAGNGPQSRSKVFREFKQSSVKMKRRNKIFPARPIKAAAGPDKRPPPGPHSDDVDPVRRLSTSEHGIANDSDEDQYNVDLNWDSRRVGSV